MGQASEAELKVGRNVTMYLRRRVLNRMSRALSQCRRSRGRRTRPNLILGLFLLGALALGGVSQSVWAGNAAQFHRLQDLVLVKIEADPVQDVAFAPSELAKRITDKVVAALETHPRRRVVIQLDGAPLAFDLLPQHEQRALGKALGERAGAQYETALAGILGDVLNTVVRSRGSAAIGVLGLPMEARRIDSATARTVNDRYQPVIDRLAAFVSPQSFVLKGSGLSEAGSVLRSMPESTRLNAGRPIIFRVNNSWRVFIEENDTEVASSLPAASQGPAYAMRVEQSAPGGAGQTAAATSGGGSGAPGGSNPHQLNLPNGESVFGAAPPDVVAEMTAAWGASDSIWDLTNDQMVDVQDLLVLVSSDVIQQLLADWGQTDSPWDLNGDGIVNIQDLILLITNLDAFGDEASEAGLSPADCNGNGVADSVEIAAGDVTDCNDNGVPDECENLPDTNGNGIPDACDTPDPGCPVGTPTWQNLSMAEENGTFTIEFDATPDGTHIDSLMALSQGVGSAFDDFAVMIRFGPSGVIDVRDGGAYGADVAVPYQPGVTYHFRADVDVVDHSFSTFVSASNLPEVAVATNYAFRTSQGNVGSLNSFGIWSGTGAPEICNIAVTASAPLVDNCPDDPNKLDPGFCGCGVPDTDSDGDGTPDCIDDCPQDSNKVEPGSCGCGVSDVDSDNDGTFDCDDNCPFDGSKTEPGECGCGTADVDSDGDGLLDCHDNCPSQANASQQDSDLDGIGDACDECPNDPDPNCGQAPPTGDSDSSGGDLGDAPLIVAGSGFAGSTPQPGPVGSATAPGHDAQAIALWDAVPYQIFADQFAIGVVAFHINGIDRVEFSADGGPWTAVHEMSLNPRTEVWEYWAVLDPSGFEDGLVEIRARIFPSGAGTPVVLQGNVLPAVPWNSRYSMFLNANSGGTIVEQETILSAGATNLGNVSGGSTTWCVIKPAPGLTRDDVLVYGGSYSGLVRLENVTHQGKVFGSSAKIWIKDSLLQGGGRTYDIGYQGQNFWITGSVLQDYASNSQAGTFTALMRNTLLQRIGEDVFRLVAMIVNCQVFDQGPPGVPGGHYDIYQFGPNWDNHITYGLKVNQYQGQGIYLDGENGYGMQKNMAFVNVLLERTQNAGQQTSQWYRCHPDHLLFFGVTMLGQKLWARETGTNIAVRGCCWDRFQMAAPFDTSLSAHNHFIDSTSYQSEPFGSDPSIGDPMFADTGNGDYCPLEGSILRDRVDSQLSPTDLLGMSRQIPATVGACEGQ